MNYNIREIFAKNLQAEMDVQGLTVKTLAQKAELSQDQIKRLLRADLRSFETFSKVADALNVYVHDLFDPEHYIDLEDEEVQEQKKGILLRMMERLSI